LYDQIGAAYQGGDFPDLVASQLIDMRRIQAQIERLYLPEERNQEDEERQDRELDEVLDLYTPPEPVAINAEVSDWDQEVANMWNNFSGCVSKSGLNQRVAVESLVRYRRAQWTQMTKEQRDAYTVWKNQRYATAQADQIEVQDLIMSPDCLYLPPSHYACPICWLSQTVHKETTANGMRQHCFKAHSIQAKSCDDPFTLALGKMIGHDVMLEAEWLDPDGGPPRSRTVRGNYLQCYHKGCNHKAVNGVGMREHLERQHKLHDSLDMRGWDIIMEHLHHNPDLTLDDLFEKKSAHVCEGHNCRFIGMTDKVMISHNLQQHQNQEKWIRATLRVRVGQAPAIPNQENPEESFSEARKSYLERMPRTTQDAEETGLRWRDLTWEEFENGIREKHPTRSEAKKIAEEGSFKKFIEMECLPHRNMF
jgi:hypothetical protein